MELDDWLETVVSWNQSIWYMDNLTKEWLIEIDLGLLVSRK